jgi:RND family efflux transporter MFP subunit
MMVKNSFPPLRWLIVTVAATVVFAGCHKKQSDSEDESASRVKAVVAVKIANIIEGDAILSVTAFGKTNALRKEKVYAPIAGRIIALKVLEGTQVKSGEVLAIIRTKESQAAIIGAESMMRSATNAQQKADAGKALELAKSTENSVVVTAKFNGFVSTRSASEGELVIENAELMTIIDLSTLDFQADVSLHDLSSVRTGQRAWIRFQSMPEKTYGAEVDAINPQTDIQSQTVRVRMRFASTDHTVQSTLRTDMIGTAQIVTGLRHHALFVPRAALLRNDEENTYSVVTMTMDSLAKSILVNVGTLSDTTAEVMNPSLQAGMPVITVGNYALADSTRVTISNQERE